MHQTRLKQHYTMAQISGLCLIVNNQINWWALNLGTLRTFVH